MRPVILLSKSLHLQSLHTLILLGRPQVMQESPHLQDLSDLLGGVCPGHLGGADLHLTGEGVFHHMQGAEDRYLDLLGGVQGPHF